MIIQQFNSPDTFRKQFNRTSILQPELTETVLRVLDAVKQSGDNAVREFTNQFDGVDRKTPRVEIEEFENGIDEETISLFKSASQKIRKFHERELLDQQTWMLNQNGNQVGQRVIPLKRVGVYVPGGTAAYPSSVLMNVIPAQVAGVDEIVLVSPPDKNTGSVNSKVLAVAQMLDVKEIYAIGGAQAIAALAFGTETIRPVDKITGPGNRYVNEAKRQVFGQVGIDSLAGPSEILIVADSTADPCFLAADLLSQAEHDVLARPILITNSDDIARKTMQQLEKQLIQLERKSIAEQSLSNQGAIVLVKSLELAVALTNEIAPEHLELQVENPEDILKDIRSAGAVFLGSWTPEPVGDYWAGSNHILPTAGAARYASALSVRDFLRYMSVIQYNRKSLEEVGEKIISMARLEGLDAHAKAVEKRLSYKEQTRG